MTFCRIGLRLYMYNRPITIYEKQWGICNFLQIQICIPFFKISFGTILTLNIFAPTEFKFEKDEVGWEFCARLMGFGFHIVGQFTY